MAVMMALSAGVVSPPRTLHATPSTVTEHVTELPQDIFGRFAKWSSFAGTDDSQ